MQHVAQCNDITLARYATPRRATTRPERSRISIQSVAHAHCARTDRACHLDPAAAWMLVLSQRPMRRFLPVQRTRCWWMVVDVRALRWAHERFVHVQRTVCSWMLVLCHRPMRRFPHVQRTRCSRMLVDARAPPWAHAPFVHAQRTGCSWMLVLSHRPMRRLLPVQRGT